MCDVPSIAVFCSESIECFPGTASKFFFKLLITTPVAPIITGTIAHFRFHIRCISIHELLLFCNYMKTYHLRTVYILSAVRSPTELQTVTLSPVCNCSTESLDVFLPKFTARVEGA